MTDAQLVWRVRRLPKQIVAARKKLKKLEDEARRYRMFDLVEEDA